MKFHHTFLVALLSCSICTNFSFAQSANDWFDKALKETDIKKKIECFDAAIGLTPRIKLYYKERGIAKGELGQYELAIQDYDAAIDLDPNYTHALFLRGTAKYELGQYESAIGDYDAAIFLDPNYTQAYYNRGSAKRRLSQFESAIQDYDAAIRLDPNYTQAYYSRGTAKHRLDQSESAIRDYDEAIRLAPRIKLYYKDRGAAKYELGQYESAIQDYDAAIDLDPNYTHALFLRGAAKYELGQYESAIQDYDAAIGLDPNYTQAYYNRGSAKRRLSQFESAIRDYDAAIRLDPNYAAAYNNRAAAKGDLAQYESAIRDYDEAIRLAPQIKLFYKERGIAKGKKGQYESAIRDYDIAIRLDPNYADAYNNRGLAKVGLGQYESAIRDYDRAISLNPDFLLAQSNREKALKFLRGEEMTDSPVVHAVAVGIDNYQHNYLLSPLIAPENQANKLARFLERQGLTDNEEVTLLTGPNARRERIITTLKREFVGPQVGTDDLIIFYFSGHGVTLSSESAGICPFDYSSVSQLITDQEIIDLLNKSPAKHKICFIETCKSENNSYGGLPEGALKRFHEARQQIKGGIVFITSTQLGKKSYETQEKGGIFSYYLFLGLRGRADRDNDNIVSTREIYDYLKENVSADTNDQQIPQINREGYELNIPVIVLK